MTFLRSTLSIKILHTRVFFVVGDVFHHGSKAQHGFLYRRSQNTCSYERIFIRLFKPLNDV